MRSFAVARGSVRVPGKIPLLRIGMTLVFGARVWWRLGTTNEHEFTRLPIWVMCMRSEVVG